MLEKGITYYWKSPKDGMYYTVKLINTNFKLKKNNLRIVGLSHCGFFTKHRKEQDGNIITLSTSVNVHDDLGLLMIEDIITMIKRKIKLDFPQQLSMLQKLRGLLEAHPDKYLKYMNILVENKLFVGLLDGKFNLKELSQDNSPSLY